MEENGSEMKKRFLHLDFKGIAPEMARIPIYFAFIKKCGFDGLVLEFDCRVNWKSWPGAGMPLYSISEAKQIVAEAERLGLEVIPLMQIHGHLEWALGEERYASLRENGKFTLCPNAPGAVEKLTEWMDEIFSIFPHSKYIHLGADEVRNLGECPVCRNFDRFEIYLKHASAMCSQALSRGIIPILWGDMFLHMPDPAEAVNHLPEGVVIVDWQYWGSGPYDSTQKLQKSRHEIWGASGLQCAWYEHFRQILPFYEDRLENVIGWNRYDGNVIHTVWGRAGNKWGVYPPALLMSLPLFIAAGDPARWKKHPWYDSFMAMTKVLRRQLIFEQEKLPAEIRTWKCLDKLEEDSREFIALGVEYQILANRNLETLSDRDALSACRPFVGSDPFLDKKNLYDEPLDILKKLDSVMTRMDVLMKKCGLEQREEFQAVFRAPFSQLKDLAEKKQTELKSTEITKHESDPIM